MWKSQRTKKTTSLYNIYILWSDWLLHNFGIMFVTTSSGGEDIVTNAQPAMQEMMISRPVMMISNDHHSFANERPALLVAYNRRQCAVQSVNASLFH